MIDMPVQSVSQEYVVSHPKSISHDELLYEVDLSFCDALAGMCSGDSSSGPSNTIRASKEAKSVKAS